MAVETTNTMIARGSATAPVLVVNVSAPVRASITCPPFRVRAPLSPTCDRGRDDPFHHKHDATGPSLVRTSENSVKAKFTGGAHLPHSPSPNASGSGAGRRAFSTERKH